MDKGKKFLHNHPYTENTLGLDKNHVIVDRDAWEYAIKQKISISNKDCDCFIGFLSGEEVEKSNIKRQVDDVVKLQPEFKKYGILNGEPQTAAQIVDGRKGYLRRFSYCPYCGQKIDWKNIIDGIVKI